MGLLISGLLNAQITYEMGDYANIGENFQVVNIADAISEDFTIGDANYSWDYSGMTQGDPESYGYEDPNNSPFKNVWCLYHFYITNCNSKFNENFNLGVTIPQNIDLGQFSLANPYQHLLKANNKLQLKMYGANVNLDGTDLPAILEYSDPDDLFHFPMNYNDSYTDTNAISMDFGALGVDLTVESEGTRTNVVEGWGSLKIPNHEFSNVIKVKSTLNQTFHINYQGQGSDIPLNMITYYWFDKDYGIPVLMVQGTGGEGTFVPISATYLYFESLGTNDLNIVKNTIYPNPTTGIININLQPSEDVKSIQIFDQSGKIVGKSLNLSNLPKGVYVLKAITSQRIIQEKVIKK